MDSLSKQSRARIKDTELEGFKEHELKFLQRIFDDIEDRHNVPCTLFKKVNSMDDPMISKIVKVLGLYYQPETLDDKETSYALYLMFGIGNSPQWGGINEMCWSETSALISSKLFRAMFWHKAGVNVFCMDNNVKQFHEPNKNLMSRKSRNLAFLLRHDANYVFDEHGYRELDDLIANHGFTRPLLEAIVAENDKQRYEFNEDGTKIRARQGHSIDVDVELSPTLPPDVLYHGTSKDALGSILREGIAKRNRQHVHLSPDEATAIKVGSRHGDPVVLKIDSKRMVDDGLIFFLSRNGVWLTDYVHPKYLLE